MKCRICGSTKNLKYTQAEIRGSQNKSKRLPLPLKEIANAINGNICKFCDLRLQNFHHEENEPSGIPENVNEVPIFVDDDERLFNIFYKRQHSEGNIVLGSDGTEVIEVLTSREGSPESTPAYTNNNNNNKAYNKGIISNKNANVVDIIELEDDDDIVIDDKVVETVAKSNNSLKNGQQETRLLGCLSLVTSDSDSEIDFEPCRKAASKKDKDSNVINSNKTKENKNNDNKLYASKDGSITIQQAFPVCKICGIRLLDICTLEFHMQEHQRKLSCPVCECQFSADLSLVYHIRKKHRYAKNIESTLCESGKCSQDSAMTIRLRFEQNVTYYECQLCGFIDSQFKAHKEHIIHQHAYESKSLRDPMMKTKLKCPACQQKVGCHNVDVCRHLLTKHLNECAMFIKELKNYSVIGVSNKALQEIQYSARVLKLINNEEQFFECRLCFKIFGPVKSFLRHLNGHNNDEWTQFKNGKTISSLREKKRTKRKTEDFSHKMQNQTNRSKNESECVNNEKQQTNKLTYKKSPSPKDNKIKNTDQMFKKPLKQINSVEITSNKIKKDDNRQKKLKRRTKNNTISTKGITRVRAKAPIRHFPTQKYNCKHCQIKGAKNCQFKGFRKLQLHLINSHKEEEFKTCNICECTFKCEATLAQHNRDRHSKALTSKRKRKYNNISAGVCYGVDNGQFDENFNTDSKIKPFKSKQNEYSEIPLSEPQTWLEELYQLSREKKRREYNLNTVTEEDELLGNSCYSYQQLLKPAEKICIYCSCLLSEPLDIAAHEKLHIESKDMPWIKVSRLQKVWLGTKYVE